MVDGLGDHSTDSPDKVVNCWMELRVSHTLTAYRALDGRTTKVCLERSKVTKLANLRDSN